MLSIFKRLWKFWVVLLIILLLIGPAAFHTDLIHITSYIWHGLFGTGKIHLPSVNVKK